MRKTRCGLFSVALIAVAIVKTAVGASTEDRVISTSSGGHVEFLVEGTGPAILMIPSLGRGASDFDDLSHRLVAAGFTTVRPEPRGIGKSAGTMTHLSLHDLAADNARAAPDAQW